MDSLLFVSGAAQSFFTPLLGALALALAGHKLLNRTMGANQGWNHAGNIFAALLAMGVIGLTETVEYAAYETLLQQSIPEDMIGAASGALDSFLFDMMLIGNVISGVLASVLGLTWAIAGLGSAIVLVTAGAWLYLRVTTAQRPDAVTLARIPLFAGLPAGTREWAARRMIRRQYGAGETIVRQGDIGDTFYVIVRGNVEIDVENGGRVTTRRSGPGDVFGEIALLQNIPRTATVRAADTLTLYTLSREDFQDLQARAAELLGTDQPRVSALMRGRLTSFPSIVLCGSSRPSTVMSR